MSSKLKDTFGVISSIKKKKKERERNSENAEEWNSIIVHAKTDFTYTRLFKALRKDRDKKHKYSRKYSIIILACPKTKAQRLITGAHELCKR